MWILPSLPHLRPGERHITMYGAGYLMAITTFALVCSERGHVLKQHCDSGMLQ
jgi:hypothetical protein